MLRRLAFLGSLAAACGGGGSWQRCGSTAECPAGTFCNAPVSGEEGVCQAPATAALTAPVPGAYVGTSAPVAATLTLATAGMQAPATVALRLGGSPVATLALQGAPAGQIASYAGTWNPGSAQNGSGSLDVLASLDVAGAAVAVSSPPVAVTVDTVPPSIQAAGASCEGGCKRDSLLNVTADVTDASVVQVAVSVDLEPGRPVAVTRAGSIWSAAVALQDWPFPWFQRTAQVTVRATDLALNEATATLPVDVTRLRWAYASGATAVTSPAVMSDGTIVFGVSATSGQLRALRPDMTEAFPPVTLGSQAVTAAPSIGPTAIWVASNDGRVYAVAHDGSGILNGSGCNTGSATAGTPTLSLDTSETSFTGSTTTHAIFSASVSKSLCNGTTVGEAFIGSAGLGASGRIFAATISGTGVQSIRRFTDPGTGLLSSDWAVAAGLGADVPLSIDENEQVLGASFDANLYRVTDNGASATALVLATLPSRATVSPLILAGGDVVVGTVDGGLYRLTSAGTEVWAVAPNLGAEVTGLVAASSRGTSDATLYGGTALGKLSAIRGDGLEVWSGQVASGALRSATITLGTGGGLPTLYAASSNGSLYAVVVDTALDTTAPWPKAHHDVRNTGNAGSPLP